MRCTCQSFNHDVNSFPYYDASYESNARLSSMIEIINEQYQCFVGEMKEFGLLSETDKCHMRMVIFIDLDQILGLICIILRFMPIFLPLCLVLACSSFDFRFARIEPSVRRK